MKREDILNDKQKLIFSVISEGYLWIFPHKDHLKIGLYVAEYKKQNLKKFLEVFLAVLGLDKYDPKDIKGHFIPHYGIHYKQSQLPCLLTGDATGFEDYWVGEGIYYTLKSGTIATDILSKSIEDHRFTISHYKNNIFIARTAYLG